MRTFAEKAYAIRNEIGGPMIAVSNANGGWSNLLIHGDDIVGRREFAADCRSVRAILYRDEGLRVALGGLTEALFGSVERVMKYNLARQDFLASRLDIGFTYLCTTDVVIQTETTKENP